MPDSCRIAKFVLHCNMKFPSAVLEALSACRKSRLTTWDAFQAGLHQTAFWAAVWLFERVQTRPNGPNKRQRTLSADGNDWGHIRAHGQTEIAAIHRFCNFIAHVDSRNRALETSINIFKPGASKPAFADPKIAWHHICTAVRPTFEHHHVATRPFNRKPICRSVQPCFHAVFLLWDHSNECQTCLFWTFQTG